jgi:SpoVK/Ycf46/Vps4 family AAA+-type ATPase
VTRDSLCFRAGWPGSFYWPSARLRALSENLIRAILTILHLQGFQPAPELLCLERVLDSDEDPVRLQGFLDKVICAAAVSTDVIDARQNIKLLRSNRSLRKREYIQVSGGFGNSPSLEYDDVLAELEFELTDKLVERLKIKRKRKSSSSAREPVMELGQLVLYPETEYALSLVVNQFVNREVFGELQEIIPYGSGVAVLFWGPPGTGKTAAAEGLADELEDNSGGFAR